MVPMPWRLYLLVISFERCIKKFNVYIKKKPKDFVIIAIYVDNANVASNNLESVVNMKTKFIKLFDMTLMVDIHFLLGIQITRN
jgi:hypothetical protein